MTDEIITEVRQIREAHAAQFKFDLRAIYDDLKASETKRITAGWPFVAEVFSAQTQPIQHIK